jgi:hypothetical protein
MGGWRFEKLVDYLRYQRQGGYVHVGGGGSCSMGSPDIVDPWHLALQIRMKIQLLSQ